MREDLVAALLDLWRRIESNYHWAVTKFDFYALQGSDMKALDEKNRVLATIIRIKPHAMDNKHRYEILNVLFPIQAVLVGSTKDIWIAELKAFLAWIGDDGHPLAEDTLEAIGYSTTWWEEYIKNNDIYLVRPALPQVPPLSEVPYDDTMEPMISW